MDKSPKRKTTRLKEYNYSLPGYYFVTICTYNRECLFGNIIDNQINLNDSGKMIDERLQTLPEHYDDILIDNYIVMPNHIHAIIIIKEPVGAAPRGRPGLQSNNILIENNIFSNGPAQGQSNGQAQGPVPTGKLSLSDIIHRFKSLTTKRYIDGVKNNNWQPFDKHVWQRSFYDHIIRTDTTLKNIRAYIINNPATWDNDEHNPKDIYNGQAQGPVPTG
ncbi:MAG: transposase [Candidatus Omnitrophota bacterium]